MPCLNFLSLHISIHIYWRCYLKYLYVPYLMSIHENKQPYSLYNNKCLSNDIDIWNSNLSARSRMLHFNIYIVLWLWSYICLRWFLDASRLIGYLLGAYDTCLGPSFILIFNYFVNSIMSLCRFIYYLLLQTYFFWVMTIKFLLLSSSWFYLIEMMALKN